MAKIEKGSRVLLAGTVTRVGEDGMVSVKLRGYDYPITLHEKYLGEVIPPEKAKPKRKPAMDKT
jgi:preprotein translocase subunit YajC